MNKELKHPRHVCMDDIISGVDALAQMMKGDKFKMDYYVRDKGEKTMNEQLKPCPFCGGKAILQRVYSGYSTGPTTIKDIWEITCENGCCKTNKYTDNIYHDTNGEIVAEANGAQQAIEIWNKRPENE